LLINLLVMLGSTVPVHRRAVLEWLFWSSLLFNTARAMSALYCVSLQRMWSHKQSPHPGITNTAPAVMYLAHRLCRPGSIVGPQQQYLESIEVRMLKEGAEYRLRHRLPAPAYASASDEVSVYVV
jgi:hypothetical protein